MENLNLAALLLGSLLSSMEPADEKGQEHSIRSQPAAEQAQPTDRRHERAITDRLVADTTAPDAGRPNAALR